MKKVNLNTYDNSWYQPGSRLKILCWYFVNTLFFLNPLSIYSPMKVWLLRVFGAKVGNGVLIKPQVNIKYPWKLSIGNHCWIGEGVWIDNLAQVVIHSNVCISQGAMLLTGNHNFKSESFDLVVNSIILKEGVWIGAQAVVCPGVTCESHAILSVGSVTSKNLEAYSVYQGNPAIKIRERIIN